MARDLYEQYYRAAVNADAAEKMDQSATVEEQARQQLEALNRVETRGVDLGVFDENAKKMLAGGFYIVKKDASGNPCNKDEKRKAEHNIKWIAAWNKWLNTQDPNAGMDPFEQNMEEKKARRAIMSYYLRFMRDMVRTPMPYEKEMYCTTPAQAFAKRDPITFLNLQNAADGIELIKQKFGDEMETVERDLGDLYAFEGTVDALKKVVSCELKDSREHLKKYRTYYKVMDQEHEKALGKKMGVKSLESKNHYEIFKHTDPMLYTAAVEQDGIMQKNVSKETKEIEDSLRKRQKLQREEPQDFFHTPAGWAAHLMELDKISFGDANEIALFCHKAMTSNTVDGLSEEEVKSVTESLEVVLGKLVSFDPAKITLQEIVAEPKYYKTISLFLGEVPGAILDFYKDAQKKYPNACKYKESDIMQVELLNRNAPMIKSTIDLMLELVLESGKYVNYPRPEGTWACDSPVVRV